MRCGGTNGETRTIGAEQEWKLKKQSGQYDTCVPLEALRQGRLFTSDLSPQELQDVLELDRTARSGALGDNRSFVQQCIDEEVRRNGGRPTRLAWEVIRLKCR